MKIRFRLENGRCTCTGPYGCGCMKGRGCFDIELPVAFTSLHEQCVTYALRPLSSEYTVDNTVLELDNKAEGGFELVLKPMHSKPSTCSSCAETAVLAEDHSPSPPSPSHISHLRSVSWELKISEEPLVFIRWVTIARALENSKLSDIPFDVTFQRMTSLPDLETEALRWLNAPGWIQYSAVKCYLTYCCLVITKEKKDMTLGDLGVAGSPQEPLNIFLVPFDENRSEVSKNERNSLWSELASRGSCPRKWSRALLEATHFPPALLALEEVLDLEENPKADTPSMCLSTYVLIDCLRELAKQMSSTIGTLREDIHQIFEWLQTRTAGDGKSFVHLTELRKLNHECDNDKNLYYKKVELPDSIAEPTCHTVTVRQGNQEEIEPALLACALYPNYGQYNFSISVEQRETVRGLLNTDRVSPSLFEASAGACYRESSIEFKEKGEARPIESTMTSDSTSREDSLDDDDSISLKLKREIEKVNKLKDRARQYKEALEEANVETGDYRVRAEKFQERCAKLENELRILKRENDSLQGECMELSEILNDALNQV